MLHAATSASWGKHAWSEQEQDASDAFAQQCLPVLHSVGRPWSSLSVS